MTVPAGTAPLPISSAAFAKRLSVYGFTECSTLRWFLLSVCDEQPGPGEMFYLWAGLCECLERHDDGSEWFADLRDMRTAVHSALKFYLKT